MKETYTPKAVINKITATSRASVKIHDSYYTVEYSEERIVPDTDDVDIVAEREDLWNTVNLEVDNQIDVILQASKN